MPMSPLVRWTARLVAAVLVVALVALLALRIYGSTRLAAAEKEFAKGVGPPAAGAPTPVRFLSEENAALFLRAGAEAMILPGNDKPHVGEMSMAPARSWTEEQRANVPRILANNRPALELLHRGAGMPKSSFGVIGSANKTEELTMGHLLKLMTAQRLLLVDGRMALLEHDPARLLADAAAMATMAGGLERETRTVELFSGVACEKLFLAALGEAVADPSIGRETLTKLQGMLVDTDLRAAWRRSNLAEQAEIGKHGAAAMSDPRTACKGRLGLYSWVMEFAVGKIFQAQQLELRVDLVAAVDDPLGLDPSWSRRGLHRPRTIFETFEVFEFVIFGETAKSSVGRVQSTLSLRMLARIALAVRLQGLATGSYPETLVSLPGAMQPDTFAGKPLTYERRPDGSARVAVPGFEDLWKRVSGASASTQRFACELPAPPKRGQSGAGES